MHSPINRDLCGLWTLHLSTTYIEIQRFIANQEIIGLYIWAYMIVPH